MATTNTTANTNTTDKVKKVTKAQRFSDIKALLSGESVTYGTDLEMALSFIDHEMELLAKKNSGEKKKTDAQVANDGYKALILTYLGTLSADDVGVTCSEIGKAIPELSEFNNQKISALLRQLVTADVVDKTVSKGKSYFKLK